MISNAGSVLDGRRTGDGELPSPDEGDFLYRRWPKPKFAQMARDGVVSPERAARFMAIYANLAPRPADLGVEPEIQELWASLWRHSIDTIRLIWEERLGGSLRNIQEIHDAAMAEKSREVAGPAFVEMGAMASGRKTRKGIVHGLSLSLYNSVRALWLPKLGWPFDERLKDEDAFAVLEGSKGKQRWFGLFQLDQTKTETLGVGTNYADRDEAEENLQEIVEEVLARRVADSKLGLNDRAMGKENVRVGPPNPRRGSRKASTSDLLEVLQIRGLEFGKFLGQRERQAVLNEVYDAFFDLCSVLRLPAAGASLWGRAGLAFGSRGLGPGVAGHFEPANWVVHIDRSGAGVLAHEMGHAIDAAMAEACGLGKGALLSSGVIAGWKNHSLARLLEEVLVACKRDEQGRSTQFYLDALKFDKGKRIYWSSPEEMFARLFEAWVHDTLAAQGRRNDFLVFPSSGTDQLAGQEWRALISNYPKGRERERLVGLMGDFIRAAMPIARRELGAS